MIGARAVGPATWLPPPVISSASSKTMSLRPRTPTTTTAHLAAKGRADVIIIAPLYCSPAVALSGPSVARQFPMVIPIQLPDSVKQV